MFFVLNGKFPVERGSVFVEWVDNIRAMALFVSPFFLMFHYSGGEQ